MLKQQCIHKGYPQKTAINFLMSIRQRTWLMPPCWDPANPQHSSRLRGIPNLSMRLSASGRLSATFTKGDTLTLQRHSMDLTKSKHKECWIEIICISTEIQTPKTHSKVGYDSLGSPQCLPIAMLCHSHSLAQSILSSGFMGGVFLTLGCTLPI